MEKCKICHKSKEKPKDLRFFWCNWNGVGKHPRFVWNRVRRKGKFCSNCDKSENMWLGERFMTDFETKEIFCFDCGSLIIRGADYITEKTPKNLKTSH